MSKRQHRSAFTLVELLVVIGIISILISILLPTMGRAREAANKAACLSNLRSIHQAWVMYAQDNKDFAALGSYGYYCERGNFIAWWWENPLTLGVLIPKYVRSPKILYCPSETKPWFQYNTMPNEWKFGTPYLAAENNGPAPLSPSGGQVKLAYGTRPFGPPDYRPGATFPLGRQMFWQPIWTPGGTYGKILDWNFTDWTPKQNTFRNRALFGDLVNDAGFLNSRHKSGVNMMYANGAGKWVHRSAFNTDLKEITFLEGMPGNWYDPGHSTPFFQNIWISLDKQ